MTKDEGVIRDLIRRIGEDELVGLRLTELQVQRLRSREREFQDSLEDVMRAVIARFALGPNMLVVPNCSAVDLVAKVNRDRRLTRFDREFLNWDFYCGHNEERIPGPGQKFEFYTWTPVLGPDDQITNSLIQLHFQKRGYAGNTGAFLQWLRLFPFLEGYYMTLPEKNACLHLADDLLSVPFAKMIGAQRTLELRPDNDLAAPRTYIGFRRVD